MRSIRSSSATCRRKSSNCATRGSNSNKRNKVRRTKSFLLQASIRVVLVYLNDLNNVLRLIITTRSFEGLVLDQLQYFLNGNEACSSTRVNLYRSSLRRNNM